MANRQNTKVRFVKCPKCLGLLKEVPDLPVYECGGCGTILQAKIRRNDLQNTKLDLPEIKADHKSVEENMSESDDKESSRTSQHVDTLSAEECFHDQENNQNSQNESDTEQLELLDPRHENSLLAQQAFCENTDLTSAPGENFEVNENETNCSNPASASSPKITDDKLLVEKTGSSMPVSPSHEQVEQFQKGINVLLHGFGRIGSTDTLGTIEAGEMSKSRLTKSPLAYDGSISSWDGNDDSAPDPRLFFHGSTSGNGKFKKGKYPIGENSSERNVNMHYQSRNSFSSNKKYSVCDSDEPMESPRHEHMMRLLHRDEFPIMPLDHANSVSACENGSPASHWHDEFHYNSSFCSPDNPQYHEKEKRRLLKMVHDLQYQLDRTHLSREHADPKYREAEIYHEQSYRMYTTMYSQRENGSHRSRFSGEAPTGSYPYTRQNYYNAPDFSILRGFDQTHRDDGTKMFVSKPKNRVAKRHFRPIAGGAPFVSCYYCLKLLQIPTDFLLFKKRFHYLKCGACDKVLKFSLQSTNHILPSIIDSKNDNHNNDYEETSSSSFEPVKERKKMYESAVPSSKWFDTKNGSLKIGNEEAGTASSLHRLMGYSSISQVFKGSSDRTTE